MLWGYIGKPYHLSEDSTVEISHESHPQEQDGHVHCASHSAWTKKGPLFQPRSLETQEMSGTYHAASYSPWHSVLFLSPNCDSSPFGVLLWHYPYNRVLELFLLVPNSSNCRCIYNKPYLTSYGYRFTRVFGHPQTFLQWSHHRRQPGDLGDFIQECWAIYSHLTCDLPSNVGPPVLFVGF